MGEFYPTRLHWVFHESWKPVCSIMECGLSGCSNHKRNSSASDVVEEPNLYNLRVFFADFANKKNPSIDVSAAFRVVVFWGDHYFSPTDDLPPARREEDTAVAAQRGADGPFCDVRRGRGLLSLSRINVQPIGRVLNMCA